MGLDIYYKKIIPQQVNENKVLTKEQVANENYHTLGSKLLFDKIMTLVKEKNIDLTKPQFYDEIKPLFVAENDEGDWLVFINKQDEEILDLSLSNFLFIHHVKELEKKHNCQYLYEVKEDFYILKTTLSNMLNVFKQCVNFTVNEEIEKLFIENSNEYGWGKNIFFQIDFEPFKDKKDELEKFLQSLQDLNFIQDLELLDQVFDFSISYEIFETYQVIYSDVEYCIKVEEKGYQRKGFKDDLSFFKQFFGSCWYVTNNVSPNYEIQKFMPYCFKNEDLNLISKTFEKEYNPIHNWQLEEDEFVYFSA